MVIASNSLTLALLSFFSTTVDDFCVILIFFAREYVKNPSMSNPSTMLSFVKISTGQFIGFSIIVGASLILGIGLHSVVDQDYIDLIGLLPILLGLYKVYEILYEAGYFVRICCCWKYTAIIEENEDSGQDSKLPDISSAERGAAKGGNKFMEEEKECVELELTTIVGTNVENGETATKDKDILSLSSTNTDDDSADALEEIDSSSSTFLCAEKMFFFLDPLTFEVAIYALMFGTDNIAIYVALFSNVSLLESAGVCCFFYAMLLVYLIAAIFIIVQVCTNTYHSCRIYHEGTTYLI